MKWDMKGNYGRICPPYSIGKYLVLDHLQYRLWHDKELIGEYGSFEACAAAAESHSASIAAILPTMPLEHSRYGR